MLRLAGKLAVSNLVKNRRLYYPFALATCLVVAISYIFNSLAFNPHLQKMQGASSIVFVLALGVIVVTIAAAIIVFYANSFVMKNRSKELGLYGMLGLNKRHLFTMVFIELLILGLTTVAIGLGFGVLFDKLIYAFLLKLMGFKVVLVSTFQLPVLIFVVATYAFIFAGLVVVNGFRILRFNALQLAKEKSSGEKKGHFLLLQTIVGLASLAYGYYLALSVKNPMAAILIFFVAVLFVILGTYLLFNAGITVFLQLLKKNKRYYYQPNNMISVSNLIFRMKKNAVGLATISILSTMVLVTLAGGINIYAGADYLKKVMYPQDYIIRGREVSATQLEQALTEFANENHLEVTKKNAYQYYSMGIKKQNGNQLDIYPKGENKVSPQAYILLFSAVDYQKMTGKTLDLKDNETAIFAKGMSIKQDQPLKLVGQELTVKELLKEDFVLENIMDEYNIIVPQSLFMVVNDSQKIADAQKEHYTINTELYGGLNIKASDKEKGDLDTTYQKKLQQFNTTLPDNAGVYGYTRIKGVQEIMSMLGGVFFIGIFLSIVFMLGTVLVIYYKQISEGYEDRERFVILQKVGLDEKQTKQTIRKQMLTVFFLPLAFAFVHLAFAYHMLSLMLKVLGVLNATLMLEVTLGVCAVFLIVYILVFLITSRSYRRIVSM
ncbi:Bacitracin export permease protein BceB [Streptococcus constellatus]|uniref:Bacitracin export permease protein BceB n=1 Tax=Streptococcus constellatus TaxID=76860 RepID=A0A564TNN5_STRCV|nr:ABC transporter permease [Streptococcus constellatus]VUX02551.1 Bacitracin export permease protein BceB [Streptococcus gordonii]VUX08852.1 Bacitracin export permease protein BceB [Streptococcus constellatus]